MDITTFYNNLKAPKKKTDDVHLITQLTKTPMREKNNEMPSISNNILEKGVFQMADLLFLPTDKFGYKYALVVIDVYNKQCDAEPLKNKESSTVSKAFKKIYARKILEIPKIIQFDAGKEFKSDTKELFEDEYKTRVKYALPNRHRQNALVERKNKEIGSVIMKFQNAQELVKGKTVKGWVSHLPDLIKAINLHSSKAKHTKLTDKILYSSFSKDLLPLHSHVRRILDFPIDSSTGKRIGNVFRSGDIRFDKTDRTIEKIILNPNLPPMYLLNGNNKGLDYSSAYTKQQLQPINEKEIQINPEMANLNKKKK